MAEFFFNMMLFVAFMFCLGSWSLDWLLGRKGKTRFLNGLAGLIMRFFGM